MDGNYPGKAKKETLNHLQMDCLIKIIISEPVKNLVEDYFSTQQNSEVIDYTYQSLQTNAQCKTS